MNLYIVLFYVEFWWNVNIFKHKGCGWNHFRILFLLALRIELLIFVSSSWICIASCKCCHEPFKYALKTKLMSQHDTKISRFTIYKALPDHPFFRICFYGTTPSVPH